MSENESSKSLNIEEKVEGTKDEVVNENVDTANIDNDNPDYIYQGYYLDQLKLIGIRVLISYIIGIIVSAIFVGGKIGEFSGISFFITFALTFFIGSILSIILNSSYSLNNKVFNLAKSFLALMFKGTLASIFNPVMLIFIIIKIMIAFVIIAILVTYMSFSFPVMLISYLIMSIIERKEPVSVQKATILDTIITVLPIILTAIVIIPGMFTSSTSSKKSNSTVAETVYENTNVDEKINSKNNYEESEKESDTKMVEESVTTEEATELVENVNEEENVVLEDIPTEPEIVNDTDATSIDSFQYSDYGEGISIDKYLGSEKKIVIPSIIEGKKVIKIGQKAFSEIKDIESVTMKDGIEIIESQAFKECSNLEEVIFSNTLLEIDYGAFNNCLSLKKIEVPDSCQFVGNGCFAECTNLESVVLGSGIIEINSDIFKDDSNLVNVEIKEGQNEAKIPMGAFVGCKSLKSIKIPKNYIEIGPAAFKGNQALESVEIDGENVAIEYEAFQNCPNLRDLSIKSVAYIGRSAFWECKSLTEIEIAEGCESVGDAAFANCISLKKVILPGSIISIGDNAFYGCSSLESFIWNTNSSIKGKRLIEENAFIGCTNLSEVILPENLNEIGSHVFSGCSSLTNINIPGECYRIGSSAFNDCKALTSVEIPSAMEEISSWAFCGCENLSTVILNEGTKAAEIVGSAFEGCKIKSIVIPQNYTYIGGGAFEECLELESFVWESSTTTAVFDMEYNVFEKCSNLKDVYIPKNVIEVKDNYFPEDVVIHTVKDSKMDEYAKENGLKVEYDYD